MYTFVRSVMKGDFSSAYRAGGKAIDDNLRLDFNDWKTWVIFFGCLWISNFVEKWLSAHYSLPEYLNFIISTIVMIPVLLGLVAIRKKLR